MRPVLELSESSLELVIGGDSITVDAEVVYLRETMTDAEITYTVKDTNIAEVDADGKVTAKAYGETTLTVAASWRNVESEFLTKSIPVYVREDVVFDVTAPVAGNLYLRRYHRSAGILQHRDNVLHGDIRRQ